MHGKPGRKERGRPQERKGERSTEEATVRRNREERERKKQRLSSQNPKLKRTKECENSGGQKEKRKRQQAVKVEAQNKPEAKAEGRGESGEAAAEIDADGRRKEIADETCMKLCEWKPKGGNHRFMMVDIKNHVVSTEKSGLFLFYNALRATRHGWFFLFDVVIATMYLP